MNTTKNILSFTILILFLFVIFYYLSISKFIDLNSGVDLNNGLDNSVSEPFNNDANVTINKLQNFVGNSDKNMSNDYEFVTFVPTVNAYQATLANNCYINSSLQLNHLKMDPISNNLYTPETCKVAAAQKQAELTQQYKLNNINKKERPLGLKFRVLEGYFDDNVVDFFKSAPLCNKNPYAPNTGITKNLSSIVTATNSYIPEINCRWIHSYSVEWTGYFIPDKTGNWQFSTYSDDASYLWLGSSAISGNNTIDNAIINNGKLHGMQRVISKIIYCYEGQVIPIRIQFGENYGVHNFQLEIITPIRGYNSYGDAYLYTDAPDDTQDIYSDSQNTNIEPLVYLALKENSPEDTKNNLFQCLVTDNTTKESRKQLNNHNNNYLETPLWIPTTPRMNVDSIRYDGNILGLYTPENKLVYVINSATGSNDSSVIPGNNDIIIFGNPLNGTPNKTPYDLYFYNISTGVVRNITNIDINKTMPSALYSLPVKRNEFYMYYNPTGDPNINIIKPNDIIYTTRDYEADSSTHNLMDFMRITSDGSYIMKLFEGQFMICAFSYGDNNEYTDPTTKNVYKYTTYDSTKLCPYNVKLDTKSNSLNVQDLKSNHTYLKDNTNKILRLVPNSEKSKYDPTFNYTKYTGFAPSGKETEKKIKIPKKDNANSTCSNICNTQNSCNYYYYYTDINDNNNEYCVYDTNNQDPEYTIIQPGSNIKNSDLNVKYVHMNFNDTSYSKFKNMKQEIITDYSKFSGYNIESTPFSDMNDLLSPLYKKAINNINTMLIGVPDSELAKFNEELDVTLNEIAKLEDKLSTESFGNIKPSFKEGLDTPQPTKSKYTDKQKLEYNGYTSGILDSYNIPSSIGILDETINQKIIPLREIASDYSNLLSEINKINDDINDKKTNIKNTFSKLSDNPIYDFSGNSTNFNNTGTRIDDLVVEDTSTMIYMENSIYILGSMTAAVLLILSVYIAKE